MAKIESRPYSSLSALGDGVCAVVQRQFESLFRCVLEGPCVTKTAGVAVLVTGEPHPFANLAVVSDSMDLAATKSAVEPLFACGLPASVAYTGGNVAPEIAEYLQRCEFTHEVPLPAMAVDIDQVTATTLPRGFEFKRIGGGAEGDAWCRALAAGYELPLMAARHFSPVLIPADMAPDAPVQFYAVLEEGKPVCTSMLHLALGVAGVYCVATHPDRRGRGLGAHATAEPLRIVRELGYGVGVLQSSEVGYSVYRRLGFTEYGTLPMYLRTPSG